MHRKTRHNCSELITVIVRLCFHLLPQEEEVMVTALRESDVITSVRRNPHNQLCLALNRPRIFRTALHKLLETNSEYGLRDATSTHMTLVTHYLTSPEGDDPGMTGSHSPQHQLSVSEGRLLLIKKLLIRILKKTGHSVKECQLTNTVMVFKYV